MHHYAAARNLIATTLVLHRLYTRAHTRVFIYYPSYGRQDGLYFIGEHLGSQWTTTPNGQVASNDETRLENLHGVPILGVLKTRMERFFLRCSSVRGDIAIQTSFENEFHFHTVYAVY